MFRTQRNSRTGAAVVVRRARQDFWGLTTAMAPNVALTWPLARSGCRPTEIACCKCESELKGSGIADHDVPLNLVSLEAKSFRPENSGESRDVVKFAHRSFEPQPVRRVAGTQIDDV